MDMVDTTMAMEMMIIIIMMMIIMWKVQMKIQMKTTKNQQITSLFYNFYL